MNATLGLGVAAAAGLLGLAFFSKARRERIREAIGRRMLGRMEHLMASLPENSPPRLVMTILPQLREQNDQIIGLLREQNALLSAHQGTTNPMNLQGQNPAPAASAHR